MWGVEILQFQNTNQKLPTSITNIKLNLYYLKHKISKGLKCIVYIITILTRNFLALLLLNSLTFSLVLVLGRSHRNFLAHLLGLVLGHLLILCRARFLHICAALSLRNINALLSGHFVALLLGDLGADSLRHLLANLPRLLVAMLGRDGRRHWLLQVVTLLHRHQSTDFLSDRCTNFLVHQLVVRCCVGSALCVGHLLTFFLGHMFTHLSRLVPAFHVAH